MCFSAWPCGGTVTPTHCVQYMYARFISALHYRIHVVYAASPSPSSVRRHHEVLEKSPRWASSSSVVREPLRARSCSTSWSASASSSANASCRDLIKSATCACFSRQEPVLPSPPSSSASPVAPLREKWVKIPTAMNMIPTAPTRSRTPVRLPTVET